MTAGNLQVVNYPKQASLASSGGITFENVVVWTFPAVPAGLAWTVSLLPCAPNSSLAGGYVNTTWQLNRNGQPELSWFGNTIVQDVQAVGGDVIQVVAYNVPVPTWGDPTYDPTKNLLTMRGYSQPLSDWKPCAPQFSPVGESVWWATYNPVTIEAQSSAGTDGNTLFAGWPGDGTALIGLQMSYALAGGNTNGLMTVDNSSTGAVYGQLALANNGGALAATVYIPAGPTNIPAGTQLRLTWTGLVASTQKRLTVVAFLEPY